VQTEEPNVGDAVSFAHMSSVKGAAFPFWVTLLQFVYFKKKAAI